MPLFAPTIIVPDVAAFATTPITPPPLAGLVAVKPPPEAVYNLFPIENEEVFTPVNTPVKITTPSEPAEIFACAKPIVGNVYAVSATDFAILGYVAPKPLI